MCCTEALKSKVQEYEGKKSSFFVLKKKTKLFDF
jgi:hypothetical protein